MADTPAPTITLPSWVADIGPALVAVGEAVLKALSSFDWAKNFPSFAGLINAVLSMLQAVLGIAASKVTSVAQPA